MLVRLVEDYEVADGDVTISVVVGQGQRGYTSVSHDGLELGHGPTITELAIGDGAVIRGTELRVSTTVTDTNPNTNLTSVTYTLKGGREDRTYRLMYEVEESGTIRYYAKFALL